MSSAEDPAQSPSKGSLPSSDGDDTDSKLSPPPITTTSNGSVEGSYPSHNSHAHLHASHAHHQHLVVPNNAEQHKQFTLNSKERSSSSSILELVEMS